VPTETPLQHHQPRGIFSTWLGMVLLFALFALIAFVVVKASPRGNDYEKKRAEVRAKKLEDARKEYLPAMTSYAWADKAKGVVRIPIEHAMQLTLAQLADSKPAAAGPVAVASPSAAPQTSPGSSAAASPAASAAASPAANANATATPSANASAPAAEISTTPKPKSVEGHDSEAHAQPAAAMNPPPAPPNTQPGPNASPAASVPSQSAKSPVSPSPSAKPSAPGTPLPVPGKSP
jgi:hypothetical protein